MTPARLPPHAPGMRIGLYGGTFDPAHAGHRHVSLLATKRLRLDRAWWIVTPGNPLKERGGLAPACERAAAAQELARHPRIDVTCFEEEIGARFTVDTLAYAVARCPAVRFVWIMGADSLASFHRWRGWERIAGLMPFAVVDRPGWTLAGRRLARRHGPVAAPHRRERRRPVAAARPARLGVPARAAFAPVVIGASSKGAKLRPVGRLKSQAAH